MCKKLHHFTVFREKSGVSEVNWGFAIFLRVTRWGFDSKQAEKNAYFSEVFKWGHSMGSFVRVWKIIIRIDEPGLLKLRPGSLLNSNRFQLFKF